jgi:serine/threonine protein phosphatase PrpC
LLLIGFFFSLFSFLGDCRAVLASDRDQRPLSEDHKAAKPSERARIEAAGGFIHSGRVRGDLAVSRSLGDFTYKDPDQPADKHEVTAIPEIRVVPRNFEEDEFILVACDGVWDVLSNQEACEFVRDCLEHGCQNPKTICEQLVDECLRLRSTDNLSVILCLLPGAQALYGDALATELNDPLACRSHTSSLLSEDIEGIEIVEEVNDLL